MEEIWFSANIVLPLLLLMCLGYFAKQKKLLSDDNVTQSTALVFRIFIPTLIFDNIRNSTIEGASALKLVAFAGVATVLLFAIFTTVVFCIEKHNPHRGVMIQGATRSNYALFGLPLVSMLYPNQDVSIAALLIAIIVPIYNVYSVIILSYCCSKNGTTPKQVLRSIAQNPLIIASALGIFFLFVPIPFPEFLNVTLSDISGVASPFALFLLGASFEIHEVKPILKQISFTVFSKIVFTPAVLIPLAIAFGFRGVELGCIVAMSGSPTSVSSFPMAVKMGGDKALASSIVLFTSTFSIFTIFIILIILKSFQLL